MWDKVLDNVAGENEKEWVLNHMAVWVQTCKKPITIPVFQGTQGSGKTKIVELLGQGVGGFDGFKNVSQQMFEGSFNEWMLTPVVLLDELATSEKEAKSLKGKTKALINTHQLINGKFQPAFSVHHNGYIAIGSNERTVAVPVIVEADDRRYCFIGGGQDKLLLKEPWFSFHQMEEELPQFMLYLISRPIDINAALSPMHNEARAAAMALSEDTTTAAVREWVEPRSRADWDDSRKDAPTNALIANRIRDDGLIQYHVTGKKLTSILKSLGYHPVQRDHTVTWPQISINQVEHPVMPNKIAVPPVQKGGEENVQPVTPAAPMTVHVEPTGNLTDGL